MITLIRPILFSFINSEKVKRLVVDLLTKLAEQTDNTVDDQAVKFIERGLFGGPWSDPPSFPSLTLPEAPTMPAPVLEVPRLSCLAISPCSPS